MDFYTIYNMAWTYIESIGFFIIIIIFLMDPVRRWNFFGYRPTAVAGLFDPHLGKVLLSKSNGAWSFNQGGMYENNIYVNVKNILLREIGIAETRYKLVYTKPLGTVRLRNKTLLTRARISTISIFPNLRGKGYMACFMRANLDGVESEIQKGAGIQDVKIVTISEAKEMVKICHSTEHQPKKRDLILNMLDEVEEYAEKVKKWESENLKKEQEYEESLQKESE